MNKTVAIKLIEGALVEKYDAEFGEAAHNTDPLLDRFSISIGDILSRNDVDVEHTDFAQFKIGGTLSSRDKELKIPGFVNVFLIAMKPLKYKKLTPKSQFLPGMEPAGHSDEDTKSTVPTHEFFFGEPQLFVYSIYKDGQETFNLAGRRTLETAPTNLTRYNLAPYQTRGTGEDAQVVRNYEAADDYRKEELAKKIDEGLVVAPTDKSKLLFGDIASGHRRGYSHYGLVSETSWKNLLAASEWVYKLPAAKIAHTADIRQKRALSQDGAVALMRRPKGEQDTWYQKYDASGYPSRAEELKKKALEIRAKSPTLAKEIEDTVAGLEREVRDFLSAELASGKSVADMVGSFKKLTDVAGAINSTNSHLDIFKKYPTDYYEKDVRTSLQKMKNLLVDMKADSGKRAAGVAEESVDNRSLAMKMIEAE